jgi:2-keto-4-pentenoate hydratase/2-oxohepta-3-ene-1,7-dioic acid hydratase in catechol pathway
VRLATLETDSGPRPVAVTGSLDDPQFVDLTAADPALPTSLNELLAMEGGLAAATKAAASERFVTGRLLAPIPDPGKVICIGLNYRDHAAESNMPIPEEPVCFSKFSQAVIGPEAPVVLPRVAENVDYEAELVVVIGKRGKNIAESDALSHVAGYTNGNDVSARDWQIGRPGGQWLLGKTPDTFAPTGPCLVTVDEIENPNSLAIALRLNGQTMQDSSTQEFIFTVEQIIAHLSQLITLEPGDLIFTGTPPGVGMARKPPVWLKPGDVCEVEIEGLGVLQNRVEAE